MKHVFQFVGTEPQTSGTGSPYAQSSTEPPRWKGFRADIVIVDSSQPTEDGARSFFEGDSIYLEGDGDSIKKVLTAALRLVNAIEQVCRKRFEDEIADIHQCPVCECWVKFNTDTGTPAPHQDTRGPCGDQGYPMCDSIWAGD